METQHNPFFNSALIVGMIFALLSTAVSLGVGYSMINSEPTGSLFTPASFSFFFVCLVVLFAGTFAVRHHVKEYNEALPMGRGAVIGLVTGVVTAVFASVFSLVWLLIDPAFNDNLMNALIANFEAISEIPAAQRDEMIDGIYTQFQKQSTVAGQLSTAALNSVFYGLINALTGMLGVKLFSPKQDSIEL
ncbi:MAG: DUF4199 domain-containing protein [Bacteroidetes bacterium]|nr:DUF4199 domain-containing protein [Bacteroidota bacterium]MCH8524285.1 DUF4199 family protein [Balneolales bacterium]